MADDGLKVKIGGDATEHNSAVESAKAKARDFGSVWEEVKSRFVFTAGDIVNLVGRLAGEMVGAVREGAAYARVMSNTTVDVKAAAEATKYLITNMELAKSANVALEAGMRLTNEQFQAVAKAATIYAQNTGRDATQALNELINAMATGSVDTLKKYGISLEKVDSTQDAVTQTAEKQAMALDALTAKYADAAVVVKHLGDQMQQMEVKATNAKHELGAAVGEGKSTFEEYEDAVDRLRGVEGEYARGLADIKVLTVARNEVQEIATRLTEEQTEASRTFTESVTKMSERIAENERALLAFNDALRDTGTELGGGAEVFDRYATKSAAMQAALDKQAEAQRRAREESKRRGADTAARQAEKDEAERKRKLKASYDIIRQTDEHNKRMDDIRLAELAKERAHQKELRQLKEESAKKITAALHEDPLAGLSISDLKSKVAGYRAELRDTRDRGLLVTDEDIEKLEQAEDRLRTLSEEAKRAREEQAAQLGIGGFGSALADAILGPPGEFEMRMESSRIAMATLAQAMQDAAAQMMEANISIAMDRAIGSSVKFVHANKEAAKSAKAMELSTGEALKAATRDVLKSVAIKAAIEAAYLYAKGLAALFLSPGTAGGLFAAAAAMTAVAAAAGGAAKAIGPVKKTIPNTQNQPQEQRAETRGNVGAGAREGANGAQTFNNYFYMLPGTDERRIGREVESTMNRARRSEGKRRVGTDRDDQQDQV